jgi:hypothetical protein
VPVLYVPGNHEYDGLDVDATHARLRSTCERLGIHWLERERWVLQGVRLLGTTLWSDFEALVPRGPSATPEQQALARGKAFRAANHHLRQAGALRGGQPWLAESVREQALACQAWLRAALAEPFDGPTVVITHFAPSLRSSDARYGLTPGTAGFATRWTRCWSRPTCGCTATCTARTTTRPAAAAWWPIRWLCPQGRAGRVPAHAEHRGAGHGPLTAVKRPCPKPG